MSYYIESVWRWHWPWSKTGIWKFPLYPSFAHEHFDRNTASSAFDSLTLKCLYFIIIITISNVMSISLYDLRTQLLPKEARWLLSWRHLVTRSLQLGIATCVPKIHSAKQRMWHCFWNIFIVFNLDSIHIFVRFGWISYTCDRSYDMSSQLLCRHRCMICECHRNPLAVQVVPCFGATWHKPQIG